MEPAPPEASPDRLTALLREAGVLLDGVVTAVEVESARETLVSRLTRLRLTYGDGGGPSHVFMKSTRDGTDARLRDFGQKEVGFYRLVAGDTPAGLLPRCYEAMVEPVVEAHARFHAAWWNDPRLGVSVGAFLDESGVLDRSLAAMPTDLAAFADRLGERLSPERRHRYERFITAGPRLAERYRSHRDLTLVHGDAHVWNALLPRPGHAGARLVDCDAWRVDTATDDLALHAGPALVPGLARPPRAGHPAPLPRRARTSRRGRLSVRHALAGLPSLGPLTDDHPDVAGQPRNPHMDLVEPPRTHHARHRRPRLPRTP